jgi:hypothetical protein
MHSKYKSFAGILVIAVALIASPESASAQYKLDAPSGWELTFERQRVREMLDTTRALYQNLVDDPRVMYVTGVGPSVPEDNPTDALPWNAIEVRNDSIAVIQTPNNLREADRAYYNYAVLRMAEVRAGDPDAPCDDLMEAEVRVVSSFVDGWIVARMLFGGPSFEPLDRLAFIRDTGQLAAFIALSDDPELGVCAAEWAKNHPEEMAAYRAWYAENYRGQDLATERSEPEEDGAGSSGNEIDASPEPGAGDAPSGSGEAVPNR